MRGHGWVVPRPDGVKAKCGGPALCRDCALELLNLPQPAPTRNTRPAVWPLVIRDMKNRDATGRAKYGTPLQPYNGRDALVDLYQELLDAVVYCRQAIYERDGK